MKQYILLYKEPAKKAMTMYQTRAQTPGQYAMTPMVTSSNAILTPNGTRPIIQALCPQTPLMDNYPSKNLSMRTIF